MTEAYLELFSGRASKQFPIKGASLTIGRQVGCDIVLDDTQASRQHCVIERKGDGFVLRDPGSRNGTLVNGQRVTDPVELSPDDVITIGRTDIRFVVITPAGDDMEMLSADDIVDEEPRPGEGAIPFGGSGLDYEADLVRVAEALPDKSFAETDIELTNARGGIVHAAGRAPRGVGEREAVDIFRLLLLVCFRSRASDIHIEPREDGHQVRLRIDGSMADVMRMPNQFGVKLTTLVKVLSDIDIAQRNTIQEGHFSSRVPQPKNPAVKRRVDYRVSFAPALHGQKLVVRILDTSTAPLKLGDLQLPAWMYEEIAQAVRMDSGMVCVAGPTGSGKTTSLYSLIRSIDTSRRNVVTIEDPVEIQIDNVTQIPVDEEHGKGFSQLLRSVLRQDPDVLLVGEVRDGETARIAMQAAITGHLVFSTIHTKDTIGTIFRLLDLGIEPYLIGQGLHIVLAQRLVRKLCPQCKRAIKPTAEELEAMGEVGANVKKLYQPRGCIACLGTGHAGRQAVFELLRVNDALRDVILTNPSMQEIQKALANSKFVKLGTSAHQLVADGVVSFEEAERTTGRDR